MELVNKLPYSFDINRVKEAVDNISALYPDLLQIGLTHSVKEMSDLEKVTECTGSIIDNDTKLFRFSETDFTEFNETFKDSYIYEMYSSLKNIGRVRIMHMNGPSAYTIHRDLGMRYHFAVRTNKHCLFLFPEQKLQYDIPSDGHLYLADTRKMHTFINGSRERRTHLVFDDLYTLNK